MRRVRISIPDQEPKEGWFHTWGGTREHVYAIVETDDGQIQQPYAQHVLFLPDDEGLNLNWWEP